MLGFFAFLFVTAMIHALLVPKLPQKIKENLESALFLMLVIYLIYQLYKLKIAYAVAVGGIYFLTYELFDTVRRKKADRKMFLICFCYLAILLFLNRGILTRVIDAAHTINFWDQYNINYQLRYANNRGLFQEKPDYKLYVITLDDNASEEERDKVIYKVKKKAGFEDYMIVILNYDEKELVSTGYSYSVDRQYISDWTYARDCVVKWIQKGSVNTNLCKYIDKRNKEEEEYWVSGEDGSSRGSDEFDPEQWDDDSDSNFPGAHWVDGYDRADGTHVDGYYRTNPDDDVTNNFNYSGPDANNNSEEYDYYYNYGEYSDPGYYYDGSYNYGGDY